MQLRNNLNEPAMNDDDDWCFTATFVHMVG